MLAPLRAQLSAAPLKRIHSHCLPPCHSPLRPQLSAAPLKLVAGEPAGHRIAPLRAQFRTAPLKLTVFRRVWCLFFHSPRSIERGPVEASIRKYTKLKTQKLSALN